MSFAVAMAVIFRFVFAVAATALFAAAVALVVVGVVAMLGGTRPLEERVLDVLGFLIIAIAVFDIAKYLLEEEVMRARERRLVAEARRSLTRIVSTIIIAVFLEALVVTFKVVRGEVSEMMFPVMLFLSAVVALVGLGLFQSLSAAVERQVARSDDASARQDDDGT